MRIIFPVRIPLTQAFLFAMVLLVVQLAEHTNPLFAATAFAFNMVITLAFNVVGGLSRPSGGYIMGFGLLAVEFGLVWKALLGEPADSHLRAPLTTMTGYLVAAVALLIAGAIKSRFVRTPLGFADKIGVANVDLGHSALGCFIIFYVIGTLNTILPNGNGSIISIFNQINQFAPLGMILGTIHTVKSSGGRRSLSLMTAVAMVYFTVLGTLFFSKQGMLTSAFCWLIGASYMRYRLRVYQVVILLFAIWFSAYFLSPISARGRAVFMEGDMGDRAALVLDMMIHIRDVRAQYAEEAAGVNSADDAIVFYDQSQGLMDRLTMIAVDDTLVDFSERGHKLGYYVLGLYFSNWVPHFIMPDKLSGVVYGGNYYAHEMGRLSVDDYTTGISFSPMAEGYHIDGFRGILLSGVLVWTIMFITTDLICGDIRRQPWGLLAMLEFAHLAPELFFAGPVNFIWFGNIGLMVAIAFCGYVAPTLGVLLGGSRDRAMLREASRIGALPRLGPQDVAPGKGGAA